MRPGIKVTAGDREWVVPSLTRGEHRRLAAEGVFKKPEAPDFDTFCDADERVAKTALLHNYPDLGDALDDLTPAEIAELARAAVYATLGMKEIPDPGAQSRKTDETGVSTSTT